LLLTLQKEKLQKKSYFKAKYKNIKYNLKKKNEGRSEKKLVKILYAKIARTKCNDNNKYIHLFIV